MAQPFCCFVDSIIRPSHYCYAINLTPNSVSNLVKKGSEYALQRELKRLQKHPITSMGRHPFFLQMARFFYQLEANPKDEG